MSQPAALKVKLLGAAANRDIVWMKRLLKLKPSPADLDHAGPEGYTALEFACLLGDAGILRLLLKAGANVDCSGGGGDGRGEGTPLIGACIRGHLECVRLLLKGKATRRSRAG